ncbi:MAG: transcriptional repressor [Beijerinckiaceae bacterium]|nr:transcriptional repressor [Beijerinckiaceae bacterium]
MQSQSPSRSAAPLRAGSVRDRLHACGLRPTRQRVALGELLFRDGDRHLAAETLHRELANRGARMSLATVYNTLRQFDEAGLTRRVGINGGRSQYDTCTGDHQHFYVEDEDRLIDIPVGAIRFGCLPAPPAGYRISRVDVLIRLRRIGALGAKSEVGDEPSRQG